MASTNFNNGNSYERFINALKEKKKIQITSRDKSQTVDASVRSLERSSGQSKDQIDKPKRPIGLSRSAGSQQVHKVSYEHVLIDPIFTVAGSQQYCQSGCRVSYDTGIYTGYSAYTSSKSYSSHDSSSSVGAEPTSVYRSSSQSMNHGGY